MFRGILGVIAGYIVMVFVVFAGLTGLWLVLGESFAFKEGAKEVTTAWIAVDLPLAFVAAILGGLVTALVAPSPRRRPVKALAGLVLVLGLGMAAAHLLVDGPGGNGEEPGARVAADAPGEEAQETEAAGTLDMWEAMQEASPPTWYHFTLPFVGVVGVLIGGCLRRRTVLSAP